MQYNQFSLKNDAGYQTTWIEDQALRFVGPDLDPYCLQRSFKINTFFEIVRQYFHFYPELLEGTVYNDWKQPIHPSSRLSISLLSIAPIWNYINSFTVKL